MYASDIHVSHLSQVLHCKDITEESLFTYTASHTTSVNNNTPSLLLLLLHATQAQSQLSQALYATLHRT